MNVNFDLLIDGYRKGHAVQAAIDYFHGRQRTPKNNLTKVFNLRRDLQGRGNPFTESQLNDVLKFFEEAGLGS